MSFAARGAIFPTSVNMAEGSTKKQDMNQYRSPSMWKKLEKWKEEKRKRQIVMKDTSKKPFKVSSTSTQRNKGLVPSKASEKMKLLKESNLKTSWNYDTSPRHLNYRKSLVSSRKAQHSDRKLKRKGKENLNEKPVRKSKRRETLTLSVSVSKSKTGVGLKSDCCKDSQKPTTEDVSNARRETLTLSTGKGNNRAKRRDRNVAKKGNGSRRELQAKRRPVAMETSTGKEGVKRSGKKLKSEAARSGVGRRNATEDDSGLWMHSNVTPRRGIKQRDLVVKADCNKLKESSLDSPSVSNRSGKQQNMRDKLEQWLLARGKTPKRAANFVKTPKISTRSRNDVEEDAGTFENVLTVDEAMEACRDLLTEGCPAAYLLDWLSSIETKLPCLSDMESFLECKKTIVESLEKQNGEMALPSENEISQPESSSVEERPEVAKESAPPSTPSRRKSRRSSFQLLSPLGELEESSSVKYQVRDATPYFKRIQQALGRTSDDAPSTMIVTPVRRSIRLSKRKSVSFASRQGEEVDICVSNLRELDDLSMEKPVQLVLRSNRALEEEFDLEEEEIET